MVIFNSYVKLPEGTVCRSSLQSSYRFHLFAPMDLKGDWDPSASQGIRQRCFILFKQWNQTSNDLVGYQKSARVVPHPDLDIILSSSWWASIYWQARIIEQMLVAIAGTSFYVLYITHIFSTLYHLVGGIPIPLKNMSSSVGIIIPTYSKYRGNIKNVPNHQPDGEFMKKTWKDPWERSMNDEKG